MAERIGEKAGAIGVKLIFHRSDRLGTAGQGFGKDRIHIRDIDRDGKLTLRFF